MANPSICRHRHRRGRHRGALVDQGRHVRATATTQEFLDCGCGGGDYDTGVVCGGDGDFGGADDLSSMVEDGGE